MKYEPYIGMLVKIGILTLLRSRSKKGKYNLVSLGSLTQYFSQSTFANWVSICRQQLTPHCFGKSSRMLGAARYWKLNLFALFENSLSSIFAHSLSQRRKRKKTKKKERKSKKKKEEKNETEIFGMETRRR